jgi:signal transduction histidine kinase
MHRHRTRTRAFSQETFVMSETVPPLAPECKVADGAGQLEAILEAVADGVVVVDREGRVLHVNPVARELLCLDQRSTGVPRTINELGQPLNPRDERGQPLSEEKWSPFRALHGETLRGASAMDVTLRTPDGHEHLINESAAPVCDAQGQITGAVVILRDVTERRRQERQTREALNTLLAMAEALMHVEDAPTNTSPDSDMAPRPPQQHDPELSEQARRLAELACRVLVCRTVSIAAVEPETTLLHPVTVVGLSPALEAQWWASWSQPQHLDERFDPSTAAALRAGELVALARPRLPRWLWQRRPPAYPTRLAPMQVGDTLVGILAAEGIGDGERGLDGEPSPHWQALISAAARLGALVLDRKRLLRERATALASELALRETNEHMDTFVGIAGHELKTPLTSLMLALQLMERRVQHGVWRGPGDANEDNDDAEPLLANVALAKQQVEQLDRLVNDLLDASRVRTGKLELHREPVDLALIVRQAVEVQRLLTPTHDLLQQIPTALHVPVIADADRIKQVVTNYLSNALKYSPADRPVAVGIAVNDREVRVWVRDEGPGLPAEEQELIWERFHRAKGIVVQTGSGIGLGLGLYICRTIIERHQGYVGVESAPGRGATFWFTLPLARQEAGT